MTGEAGSFRGNRPMAAKAKRYDPRDIVTPYAFTVAPDLLGLPLATAWRRGAAMLVDLGLLSALSAITGMAAWGGFLLAVAAAVVFFRIAAGPARGHPLSRLARFSFGCLGSFVLFVTVLAIWGTSFAVRQPLRIQTPGGVQELRLGELPSVTQQLVTGAAAVGAAQSERQRLEAASRIVGRLTEMGVSGPAIAGALESVMQEADTALPPRVAQAMRAAIAAAEAVAPGRIEEADSLVLDYAAALAARDTVRAALLRPRLIDALAGDRIAGLEERIDDLEEHGERLEEDLEQARENPGILGVLRSLADDLGVGVGWAALYFTVFTTLWRGQTPGKRLVHLRVVRLDGEPISWWAAFERFGGYAAGIATGLLGFAQIFWDPNRQAVHDKIVATVVIHEGRARRALHPAGRGP